MSQWTHVIGTIQCHWSEEEAIELLGKPVLWSDTDDLEFGTPEYYDYHENIWCAAFDNFAKGKGIPMGSEGSVDWYFVKTKDQNCLGEGSLIAIQGDLRDFGGEKDIQGIIDWFVNAAKHARFATLIIKDEYSDEYIHIVTDWGHIMIAKSASGEDE